jgi:NAD+ diphosphatase
MKDVLIKTNDSLLFCHQQTLLSDNDGQNVLFKQAVLDNELQSLLARSVKIDLGNYDGGRCYFIDIEEPIGIDGLVNFRAVMPMLPPELIRLISRGMQLVTWSKQHQFCGQCGQATHKHTVEDAYHCQYCELFFYPRISPCMMSLITKGDYCLLAQHQKHRGGFYSTLAGFVEAGENVEQTVHREVMEEVGLKVGQLSYFTSQPWPFPHQLMIGFFAEYQSGDITIDDDEIIDAQWFHYTQLPEIPPPETLSGMMIAAFVKKRIQENTKVK